MPRRASLVRLTAPDERWVRRGALLLEDALRTATIPGAGPGRMLLVRHLDVGTIHAGRSAVALSVAIEDRLRLLRSTAVHAASAGAAQAQAVYFDDESEAFTLLALRIMRQQPVDAWFWRLVVPDLDRREPLRSLVWHVIQTTLGPVALVHFMAELAAHDALAPVLSDLTESDGFGLLAAMRWSSPAVAFDVPASQLALDVRVQAGGLSPSWRAALRTWLPRWDRDDPRAVWLAGIVLAATLPARMMDPSLPHRAAALIALIVTRDSAQGDYAAPEVDGESERASDASPAETTESVFAPYDLDRAAEQPSDHAASLPPDTSQSTDMADDPALVLPPGGDTPRVTVEDIDRRDTSSENRSLNLVGVPSLALPPETAMGGLFFLVHILERLGFSAFLTAHPQWIEAELGWAILREVAFALALPESDPIHVLFEQYPPLDSDLPYACPAQWVQDRADQSAIAALDAVSLHRIVGLPLRRVLLDGTGDLPLAVWTGKAPPAVRHMLGRSRIFACQPLPTVPSLARAWLVAVLRWLDSSPVQLDLSELVVRRGFFNATRTHIDVVFDHNQTDLRVRRLGLDFNPGWVPWLGRVVYFHFVQGAYGN